MEDQSLKSKANRHLQSNTLIQGPRETAVRLIALASHVINGQEPSKSFKLFSEVYTLYITVHSQPLHDFYCVHSK